MTTSIPVCLLEGWISEMQSILKAEISEGKTDITLNQGMRHGLDQIQSRLNTWLRHQKNMEALARSGKRFLITKDVVLSDGRYRKLEWYEGDVFVFRCGVLPQPLSLRAVPHPTLHLGG